MKKFKIFLDEGAIPKPNIQDVALFIGRLQPPHKGHEAVIRDAFKNHERVVVVIIEGKKTKEEQKNFLTFEQRAELIKKMNPKVDVIKSDRFFIGFILFKLLGITGGNITVYAGPDRLESYKRSEVDNKFYNFTWKETSRITSATKVRETLADDNFNEYKKHMPTTLATKQTFDYLRKIFNEKI